MENSIAKIDLSKLSGFGISDLKGASGSVKKCAIIPIEDNDIFIGQKGVYLSIDIIKSQSQTYGDTHFIVRSKSKKERETEAQTGERVKLPIIGNVKPFAKKDGVENTQTQQSADLDSILIPQIDNNNDLPF